MRISTLSFRSCVYRCYRYQWKTTTTYLVKSILATRHRWGDRRHRFIGDSVLPAERTTPESLDLQRLFRKMVDNGYDGSHGVSSHAVGLQSHCRHRIRYGVIPILARSLDFHLVWKNTWRPRHSFCAGGTRKEGKAAI